MALTPEEREAALSATYFNQRFYVDPITGELWPAAMVAQLRGIDAKLHTVELEDVLYEVAEEFGYRNARAYVQAMQHGNDPFAKFREVPSE